MLFKIAWRNLWRNKRRSLIVLSSIIVGVASMMIFDSLGRGFMKQMLDNQISTGISHIQIHKKGFNDNRVIQSYIPDSKKTDSLLRHSKFIKAFSKRIFSTGLLSSANASTGIALNGVEPDQERYLTSIIHSIIEGKYLSGKQNEIIIGSKLADKLEVGLGDKVVAVASASNGSVISELFRISGIFKTGSTEFDKAFVFINLKSSQEMLGLSNNVSEFAMLIDNTEHLQDYQKKLINSLGSEYEVLSYKDLLPLIISYVDLYNSMIYIYYIIIFTAVIFSVINTMLMSVFERVHEFGVLMSIGMKRIRVFMMVIAEALVIGGFGTILGFIFGYLLYLLLKNGIDLSIYADSLSSFGMGSVLYPQLDIFVVLNSLFLMPLITMLGAVYPARKAIKLQPTEALRYV